MDILLLAQLGPVEGKTLRESLLLTFRARGTHPLPVRFPDPPAHWSLSYRRLAEQTGLDYPTLADSVAAMHQFLDPVLGEVPVGNWNPALWAWD